MVRKSPAALGLEALCEAQARKAEDSAAAAEPVADGKSIAAGPEREPDPQER